MQTPLDLKAESPSRRTLGPFADDIILRRHHFAARRSSQGTSQCRELDFGTLRVKHERNGASHYRQQIRPNKDIPDLSGKVPIPASVAHLMAL